MELKNFIKRTAKKGIFPGIILALLFAFIFSSSVILLFSNTIEEALTDESYAEYEKEFGCEIIDYQLECTNDYYEYQNVVIDLNAEEDTYDASVIYFFYKDGYNNGNFYVTYKELMEQMGYEKSSFTFDDAREASDQILPVVRSIGFAFLAVLMFVAYLILGLINTGLLKSFIERKQKETYKFKYFYVVTMFAMAPMILLNAATRYLFSTTALSFITGFLPLASMISILAYYAILYFIILWILKGEEDELEDYYQGGEIIDE